MKTLTNHREFPKHDNGHVLKDWEGYKHAWFVPDNVIYIAPDGHRYLIRGGFPTKNLQSIMYTTSVELAKNVGYSVGKIYPEVHSGRGFVVYAFLPAFSKVIYKPAAWFDHVKNNPDELKR